MCLNRSDTFGFSLYSNKIIMPLPYISIDNFRAFKKKTNFEFAPITILTGANSSGKSSLVDSIRILENYFNELGKEHLNPHIDFWNILMDFKVEYFHSRIPAFVHFPNHTTGKENICFEFKCIMCGVLENMFVNFEFQKGLDNIGNGILKSLKITSSNDNVVFELKYIEEHKFFIEINYGYFLREFKSHVAKEIAFCDEIMKSALQNLNFKSEEEYVAEYNKKNYKNDAGRAYSSIGLSYEWLQDENLRVKLRNIYPELLAYYLTYGVDFYDGRLHANSIDYNLSYVIPFLEVVKYTSFMPKPEELEKHKKLKEKFIQENSFFSFRYKGHTTEDIENNKIIVDNKLADLYGNPEFKNIDLFTQKGSFIEKIGCEIDGKADMFSSFEMLLSNPLYAFTEDLPDLKITVDSDDNLINFYRELFSTNALRGITYEQDENIGNLFFNDYVCKNISKSIKSIKSNLQAHYIPSLRIQPQRFYLNKEDAYFVNIINEFLSKNPLDIELAKKFLISNLKRFGIGDDILISRDNDLGVVKVSIIKNNKTINLSDCGFGVLQLLPILLRLCIDIAERVEWLGTTSDGKPYYQTFRDITYLIEEPETNLHPALQSKLADMFVYASNSFDIQFIIETHSEYLIRRLQGMVVEKKISPKKVKIYYFHHPDNIPEGEPQVYPINIESDGALSKNFGKGFFDEAANLNIALYNFTKEQHN